MNEDDWGVKRALIKVPVFYLMNALDFPAWQLALRRLVGSCSMIEALLYSIPERQAASMEKRLQVSAQGVKKEMEAQGAKKTEAPFSFADDGGESKATPPPVPIDLTAEQPLVSDPVSEQDQALRKAMGLSQTMTEFFLQCSAINVLHVLQSNDS